MRIDGRRDDQLRTLGLELDYTENPLASVLCCLGRTRVVCTVSEEKTVPRWLRGRGQGWVTAEYAMLPAATDSRTDRESVKGKQSGRTMEIQRLIGRSLRAVADLRVLGERSLLIDCDVLQADGGTRTASITGAYVALAHACHRLRERGDLKQSPMCESLAAVSVGIVDERVLLDLAYEEDSRAEVDMNVVATGRGQFVEVQGTGEAGTFSIGQLSEMTELALSGISEMSRLQAAALTQAGVDIGQSLSKSSAA